MGFFNLLPALGMICVYKNMHITTQHPSLGSMNEGPIDTSEVLIPILKFEQELSIHICFNLVKIDDLTHPK